MRITLAYNLKTADKEEQAEFHTQQEIDQFYNALRELGHKVSLVEVSDKPNIVIERLIHSEPDLIFNIAEGRIGATREAFYPGIYEQLQIPFTGSGSPVLHLNMDKQLTKTVASSRGVRVPKGCLITEKQRDIVDDFKYPLIIKPNYEGSSKGISQKSVVQTPQECKALTEQLLKDYPDGIVVEEFIKGREFTAPLLEAYPGEVLEVVELTFDLQASGAKYNIYDYRFKYGGGANFVSAHCPAQLTENERKSIVALAKKAAKAMNYCDYARVDVRLADDGTPYFIEMNPLPSLEPDVSHMIAATHLGLKFKDVLRLIIRSAAKRYKLSASRVNIPLAEEKESHRQRPTMRELGISAGYFDTGEHNAITDVKGVKVGHVTYIENDVEMPGIHGKTKIRTGVTAILPGGGDVYSRHIMAGGFVLNGIGEMAGLTQALEWGWIETPVMLTNTVSVGPIHSGVIDYMAGKYKNLHREREVIIPLIGETDDSFLNDVRIRKIVPKDAARAVEAARSGPVAQGSVGAGTGMTTFDFAGGIGTSSRLLPHETGNYTLGVLVLSNFGNMRNLTINGNVVGRELDEMYPTEKRRRLSYGSIIVVVATDAPLLSSQLSRISKRAALGLGRTGSFAGTTSGEIIIAFSTSNRVDRFESGRKKHLNAKFISDAYLDPLYEVAVEATEEAVLNAIFSSGGMDGRNDNYSPPLPHDKVLEILGKK